MVRMHKAVIPCIGAALSIPGAILSYIIVYNIESRVIILISIIAVMLGLLMLTGVIISHFERKAETHNVLQLLRDFIDSVPMGVEIFDKEYNCIEVNKATEVLFNTTKQEYISNTAKYFPKFQPNGKESREFLKSTIKEAYEKGSVRYEFVYKHADGTPFPVMEFSQRIMINGVAHIACYTQDKTGACCQCAFGYRYS